MLVAMVALASERGGEGLQEGFKGHSGAHCWQFFFFGVHCQKAAW